MRFSPKSLVPRRQRQQLRVVHSMARHYKIGLQEVLAAVRLRSVGEVLSCLEDFHTRPKGRTEIWVRRVGHPIQLRHGTSDFQAFRQVFLERQYNLPIVASAEYIIDAGANVGLASVYFLSRNRHARIVAIEPDPENFEIARENLRPYADRCRLVHGALWSHSSALAISRGTFGDGRHWATRTIPTSEETNESVRAYTIKELIQIAEFPRIDLLKMDIEGAELQVFRDGPTEFLEQTQCCAVECHDEECVEAYSAATDSTGFQLRKSGELLIAERV